MPAKIPHPGRVAGGREGARRRWGPRRHVNLSELDADTARLVRALVDAAEEARAKAEAADDGRWPHDTKAAPKAAPAKSLGSDD